MEWNELLTRDGASAMYAATDLRGAPVKLRWM